LDSESVIAATFSKFGVRFSAGGIPNSSVRSKEDFFVYAIKNMFFDGRTAKAVTSWSSVFFDSLDEQKLFELISAEDENTRTIVAALLAMLGKNKDRFRRILNVNPFKERFAPLGEYGNLGNGVFEKYNISAPGLSPEPQKYIKVA
jgi:hypothetical protein